MKEKFAIGTALVFASAAPVFGEYESNSSNSLNETTTEQRSSSCCNACGCDECNCPAKDPCAKCAQLWPSDGPDWIITPGAGPCTADGCDFFITAEFIYWAVRQDHLGFAYTLPTVNNENQTRGDFLHPDWRMEPGFKVGIGWLTDCDGWDLYLNYTWLRPRTKKKTLHVKEGFQILDFYTLFNNFMNANASFAINQPIVQTITSRWELDFNVLDLEWGRNFYISKCVHMRPHFGLKGTWQCNDLKLTSMALSPQTNGTTPDVFASNDLRQDSWGIGPRAGLDTAWHWNKCFSVVGEVAASALWGKFSSKSLAEQESEDSFALLFPITPNTNLRTSFHSVKPVLEFFLGLRWEDWWCCDEYYFAMDLGWEVQWWAGQNQHILAPTETRWGDLGLQGLTLRFRFQF